MGRKRVYKVVKHLPVEGLNNRIKKLEKDTRILKKQLKEILKKKDSQTTKKRFRS